MKIIHRDGKTVYFTCEEDGHTYYGSYEDEPWKDALIIAIAALWFLPPAILLVMR